MSLRTSLQRLARRGPDRPTLRERLAAGKARIADIRDRAALAAKVGRVALQPVEPEPEPPNRVALTNYATWLWHERRRVCAELYPHRGIRADAFVLGLNAAEDWHFKGRDRSGGWAEKPPATARAVQILDAVGVDWRADEPGGLAHVDTPELHDTGDRPRLPHGWPAPDAALLEALDDLRRLDAALAAMHVGDDRSGDEVPGYAALEEARDDVLDRLAKRRAQSLDGLQAKAAALLTRSVSDLAGADFEPIATSLARDLTGASQRAIEPRPDPIHEAIAESRRLFAAYAATDALPDVPGTIDPPPEARAAHGAFHQHSANVLLKTVPTTAQGCAALARYVSEFSAAHGWHIDEDSRGDANLRVLALIARSPLL